MRQDDTYQDEGTQARPSNRAPRRQTEGRQAAAANPLAGIIEKARELVSSRMVGQAQGRAQGRTQARNSASPRGGAAFAGEDYLGTGEPCRVCGRPVEPTQSRCPHCGAFRVPLYQQVPFWVAVVVLVALVVVLSCVVNSCGSSKAGMDTPVPSMPAASDSPVAQDKSDLSDALANGQTYVDDNAANGTYTVASIDALRAAMNVGQAAFDDEGATEDEVSEATQAISDAVGGLMKCATGLDGYSWLDYDTLVNSAQANTKAFSAGSGVVLQVAQGTDYTTLSVAFGGDSTQVVNVAYNDLSVVEGAPTEGSSITFAGTVTSASQYENADGETVTTPTLVADYVYVDAAE